MKANRHPWNKKSHVIRVVQLASWEGQLASTCTGVVHWSLTFSNFQSSSETGYWGQPLGHWVTSWGSGTWPTKSLVWFSTSCPYFSWKYSVNPWTNVMEDVQKQIEDPLQHPSEKHTSFCCLNSCYHGSSTNSSSINLANPAALWHCWTSSLEAERFLDCEGGREGDPVAVLLNEMIQANNSRGNMLFF